MHLSLEIGIILKVFRSLMAEGLKTYNKQSAKMAIKLPSASSSGCYFWTESIMNEWTRIVIIPEIAIWRSGLPQVCSQSVLRQYKKIIQIEDSLKRAPRFNGPAVLGIEESGF